MKSSFVVIALILACAGNAQAESLADSLRDPFLDWRSERARIYLSLVAGDYDAPANPDRLEGERLSFGLGGLFGYEIRPWLAIDVEAGAFGAQYDAPPFPTTPGVEYDHDMSFSASGVALSAKAFVTTRWLEAHVRAGPGFYSTKMLLHGTSYECYGGFPLAFCIPHGFDVENSNLTMGPLVAAGFDVSGSEHGRWSVGFEVKQLWLRDSFGNLSHGQVDVGGRFYTLIVTARSHSWTRWN